MDQGVEQTIEQYLALYRSESEDLSLLREQVSRDDWADITARNNFVGHITASIFIITQDRKVLLLQHKKLNKLLQPGGHVDYGDISTLHAALRELREETGIEEDSITHRSLMPSNKLVPFHIDTHHIPENPKKHEDAHYHHDFQYLAIVNEGCDILIDPEESISWEWVDWKNFKKLDTFTNQSKKIDELLNKNSGNFFHDVIGADHKHISLLVVSHILPSTLSLLRFLYNNFNLIGVIPKPKSIDKHTYEQLNSEGLHFIHVERGQIDIDFMNKTLSGYEDIVMLDVGGYFSGIATRTKKLENRILGIVEDTENGQQKYEANLNNLDVPIYSVARSPLKDNEDYLVGQSVAHAADTMLRQTNKLASFSKCAVIGYGKVGRGICDYLISLRVRPTVCEADPERLISAYNHGCNIVKDIDELLTSSDIIFCATGSKALNIHKFRKIKNGTYLASVTSSDDEFDLEYLNGEYKVSEAAKHVTLARNGKNYFYLLNDGNAINFLYNASLGDFIHLVQAEMVHAATKHTLKPRAKTNVIHTIDATERKNIAQLWIKEFI